MNTLSTHRHGCAGWLGHWLISAGAVWITSSIVPGIHLRGFGAAMIVALILGLLNLFVRPLLILLTIPATILTLGLFLFVVNAIILGLAASLVQGFSIDGFLPAIVGALVLGFAQSILQRIFEAR